MATLVYLQTICDQLKDALELGKGMNVAALIDEKIDSHQIMGWCVVRVLPDGKIKPVAKKTYKTIGEMINSYQKKKLMKQAVTGITHLIVDVWDPYETVIRTDAVKDMKHGTLVKFVILK